MKYDTSNNLREFIGKYLRGEEKEIVDLACKLINTKTENPPGNEILATRVVADFFQSLQIPYELFEKTKDRTNIIGYIGGRDKQPSAPALLVACHLDVVPAGDDWNWERNPFEAWREDGRIYGRGSSDNKGQMASMMAVARFLKGQFLLAGVADEERGSALGLEYLLNECGIKADYAIIPDVAHNIYQIKHSQ